ncbi:hypothetical protein SH668x_002829 [Planctomicrobium sp. SH668]|uniref:hypothetical protein n=1 Tax=Planctomicrobium sp. SH668 TaxID=3448126 RepID=UPI003F5C433A
MPDSQAEDASTLFALDGCHREFDAARQSSYLHLLTRGASPAVACQQLGLSLVTVAQSLEANSQFRGLWERVNELLSQNVAAALYRSAMEGSVSAQTFYLKNKPPPEWPSESHSPTTLADEITDDELIEQFRKEAPLLLAQLATQDSSEEGSRTSRDIPESAQTSRRRSGSPRGRH